MDSFSLGQTSADVAQADEARTKRAFIGLLSSALGVDQIMTTDDAWAANTPGQYVIANPDGTYSKVGQSVSNLNSGNLAAGGFTITPGLLIVGALAFLLFKSLK